MTEEHRRAVPKHQSRFRLLLAIGILLCAVPVAWFVVSGFGSALGSEAAQAGLEYAQSHTVWISGPSVHSTDVVRLNDLQAALNARAPATLRSHVNVPDLIRRYGPNRQVALVLLAGTYNTLPPDEGVVVHGDMVEVVDMQTRQVLLLTD